MHHITIPSNVAPANAAGITIGAAESRTFAGYGYIAVSSGGSRTQTYATATELRAIAHAATMLADELEMVRHPEPEQQGPAWVFA